jgi:hypothetical protein
MTPREPVIVVLLILGGFVVMDRLVGGPFDCPR